MSGGPVFNSLGQLIGLNGKQAYPIWGNFYRYDDGSGPPGVEAATLERSSWSIPIETAQQRLKGTLWSLNTPPETSHSSVLSHLKPNWLAWLPVWGGMSPTMALPQREPSLPAVSSSTGSCLGDPGDRPEWSPETREATALLLDRIVTVSIADRTSLGVLTKHDGDRYQVTTGDTAGNTAPPVSPEQAVPQAQPAVWVRMPDGQWLKGSQLVEPNQGHLSWEVVSDRAYAITAIAPLQQQSPSAQAPTTTATEPVWVATATPWNDAESFPDSPAAAAFLPGLTEVVLGWNPPRARPVSMPFLPIPLTPLVLPVSPQISTRLCDAVVFDAAAPLQPTGAAVQQPPQPSTLCDSGGTTANRWPLFNRRGYLVGWSYPLTLP